MAVMALARKYETRITDEISIYEDCGAAPRLAKVMASHFRLFYHNPGDSMQDIETKLEWAAAYADDLAIRKLLLEDGPNASRLLHLAQRESKSAEPNPDRELIIRCIDEVIVILQVSVPLLDYVREKRKLPSLDTYLK